MPIKLNLSKLSLPLGGAVLTALRESRVLFLGHDTEDDTAVLLVIGRDLTEMRAARQDFASRIVPNDVDETFFVVIDGDYMENLNNRHFEGTAPLIDGAGRHIGEIDVTGPQPAPALPTVFGIWLTELVLFEQIKQGDVFGVGESVLDHPDLDVLYRALEDWDPASVRLHVLEHGWDDLSNEKKLEEVWVAERVPPTMLAYRVLDRGDLLEAAGIKDIVSY